MKSNYLNEFEEIAAEAINRQPVRFDVDKRQIPFANRVELSASLGALATALEGEKRAVVILCAQACGLVLQ